MPEKVPIYRYTILTSIADESGHMPVRVVDAMNFREEEPWIIFDDTRASVLVVRADRVVEIERSADPVSTQTVDTLTDPIPED